jgi:hypothetical protein
MKSILAVSSKRHRCGASGVSAVDCKKAGATILGEKFVANDAETEEEYSTQCSIVRLLLDHTL